ncbi:MAG: DUF3854 domain-containing protein [Acidobacteriota bacterium]
MIKWRVSSGYARVSKRRPCRVCGKPDWCIYTRDEQVTICMRVSQGARRINRQGGAIFVHISNADVPFVYSPPKHDKPQSSLAPICVRDFAYRTLIRLSPATSQRKLLVEGQKGLLTRGLAEHQIHSYGALPTQSRQRDLLAGQTLEVVKAQFPEITSLRGVPGFWRDSDGWHLWTRRDFQYPRLLIPCRDRQGLIQACQMRCFGLYKHRMRYCWLSSNDLPDGTSSGNPLHFTFRPEEMSRDATIVIVEGLLKADVLAALRPQTCAVATAGVASNHEMLIKITRGRCVLIAFDQDYYTNEAVCLRLAALLSCRIKAEKTLKTTQIAAWPRDAKGIDDAVALNHAVWPISIERWFHALSRDLQRRIDTLWPDLTARLRC